MQEYENRGMGGLFREVFDEKTGFYARSDILDGPHKGEDPFMRAFPALMDVGIMGHCVHGVSGLCAASGVQCYQNGLTKCEPNMSLADYQKLVNEAEGKCFQIALGGRGDPDMHPDFEAILKYSREHHIVPNFTTSGLGMTKEKAALCRKYCGAVAVSMYSRLKDLVPELAVRAVKDKKIYQSKEDIPVRFTLGGYDPDCYWEAPEYRIDGKSYGWDELHHMVYGVPQEYEFIRIFNERRNRNPDEPVGPLNENYTFRAIQMLLDAGVTTNIHFVLSRSTIKEAILRLKYNGFPKGINAVVFLLHKPIGQGVMDEVLDMEQDKDVLKEFFDLVDNHDGPFQIGFDSCTVPGLLNLCQNIDMRSLDTCEAARYSMYVTSDMKALPCSFDNVGQRWAFDLKEHSIEDAWKSKQFDAFRTCHRTQCAGCKKRDQCFGGCPICRDIVLCKEVTK